MNFKKELSIMKNFYLMSALAPFTNLTQSVFMVYLFAIGFSPSLIGVIFAASSLFTVLFELPTGVVADVFGRKLSYCIGVFLNVVGLLILVLSVIGLWILICFVIASFGYCLICGGGEGWLVVLLLV